MGLKNSGTVYTNAVIRFNTACVCVRACVCDVVI